MLHHTSGDGSHLGDAEGLSYLEGRRDLLLDLGREHALHSGLDVLDRIIDNRVEADLHSLVLSSAPGALSGTYLEAYDQCIRGGCEVYITLADCPDSAVDHVYADLFS